MKINKRVLRIILLVVGTVAITFSGLNWHIGFTAWIGTIFLLMYSRKATWREFLLFFAVMSISGAISQTGNNLLNLPAVNVFNGLSFGILCSIPYVIDKLLYKKSDRFYYTLIFPASVTLVEFVTSFAIGTWGSIAHTQYEFKSLMQMSSVTGIFGVWFIIAWFASIINQVIENKSNRRLIYKNVIFFCSVLFIVLLYGEVRIKSHSPIEKKVKVATVLSETDIHRIASKEVNTFKKLSDNYNIEVPARMFSDSLSVKKMIARTGKAAKLGAKIIVWNEIALIVNKRQKEDVISKIQSVCIKDSVYVLVAVLEECVEENKKPFNNISILISPEGKVIWEYKKSFLQPTAEAPIVNTGNFELPVVQTEYGRIGNVICADLDMQNYIKQAGEKLVDILLVPAYDWPGITPLHSQMASVESIQFGFALVRSNGKGLSAIYDYKGNEIASLNTLNTNEKILLAELPVRSVNTIYSQAGNVFPFLCLAFIIFIFVENRLKTKGAKK